ncbi:hypothetical protein ACLOJK_015974 [Asimina triloba]
MKKPILRQSSSSYFFFFNSGQRTEARGVEMSALESVVSFLLGKLDTLLTEEVNLLKGVRTQVRWIRGELEGMQAFLRDAEERAETNAGVNTWVKQVREASYEIDDVLDEFKLRLSDSYDPHVGKILAFLRKTTRFIRTLKARHRIASQIQDIKTQIADISSRQNAYGFSRSEQQGPNPSSTGFEKTSHLRSTARFAEEANLVGIEGPRNELIQWLESGELTLTATAVFGMGGLGKTTLAGKVYDSKEVKANFETHAWITVSQSFIIEDIFRRMVKEFCGSGVDGLDAMDRDQLINYLKSHLRRKRYVIVLDDVWRVDDWECIKIALPEGKLRSRIIVTTRHNGVASHCTKAENRIYPLQPLPFPQGWILFCRNAFGSGGATCPPHLKDLAERFVKRCEGLPLAIVAIGGLLYTKNQNLAEWRMVDEKLGNQIESNPHLTPLNQTLLLSINDLPYHLKSCFLYLSLFPEDYVIQRMRLLRLWMAEGFIEVNQGMAATATVEDVASDYLNELINRSLIQVAVFTDYGKVRACRVHDVVREIILSKSKDENSMKSISEDYPEVDEKTRRISLHYYSDVCPGKDGSSRRLRSLLMFGENRWPDRSIGVWFSSFRLLRVLDLENATINRFPEEIVNLLHLRFLSLRNTNISSLPESLGKLENLVTLDLKRTNILKLPNSIINLERLRHLLAYRDYTSDGVAAPAGLSRLRLLQKLSYVDVKQDSRMVREIGNLTQLRRLGIVNLGSVDVNTLCTSLQNMSCLSSFAAMTGEEGILNLQKVSPPPPLENLYLRGRLGELPPWIPELSNLVRLTLRQSGLKDDPFEALQHLPNLMELQLWRSYDGEALHSGGTGFQKLNSLILTHLQGLKLVTLDKGAMPCLQKLCFSHCWELEKVPAGIEHLPRLKHLVFRGATDVLSKNEHFYGYSDDLSIASKIIFVSFGRRMEMLMAKKKKVVWSLSIEAHGNATVSTSTHVVNSAHLQIPNIDLQVVVDGDRLRRAEIVEEIRQASTTWGFFQAVNHGVGVDVDVLEMVLEGVVRFFEQPKEVNAEYFTRDDKEKNVCYSYQSKAANWRDTLGCVMVV